jgi:hypothetical protein
MSLVNQPSYYTGVTENRVDPGHPEDSFLVIKLVAMWDSNPPNDGLPMPYGGSQLPAAQEQAIQDWIANGAQNN